MTSGFAAMVTIVGFVAGYALRYTQCRNVLRRIYRLERDLNDMTRLKDHFVCELMKCAKRNSDGRRTEK